METEFIITGGLLLALAPVYLLKYIDYASRQISIRRVILQQCILLVISWVILIGAGGRFTLGLSLYCAVILLASTAVQVSQTHPGLSRHSNALFLFGFTKAMCLLLWVGSLELSALKRHEPIALLVYVYAAATFIITHYECMLYVMSKPRFNRHLVAFYSVGNHKYK